MQRPVQPLPHGTPLPPLYLSAAGRSKDLHKIIVFIHSVHLLRQDLEVGQVDVKQVFEAWPLDLDHRCFSSV